MKAAKRKRERQAKAGTNAAQSVADERPGGGVERGRRFLHAAWVKRAVVAGGWAVSGWLGALQLLYGWRYLNPDGVSYLDLGKALLGRRMLDGYSGYWSPLYAVLAAGGAQLAEWGGRHRLMGVQAVNLAIYLAALAACGWMMRKVVEGCGGDAAGWRTAGLQVGAMSLFCMTVIRFGGLMLVTPDVLVAGLTMLAAGLTASLANVVSVRTMVMAGAVMGLGYWAKAIFFPLWWWWVATSLVLFWRQEGWRKGLAWAVAAWAVVALPLVAQTSRTVGRLSFGEVGRLSVMWYVSKLPAFAFWEGREAGHGTPAHPLRTVQGPPRVFVFGEEFPEATYPVWYAPWHWYEGARVKVTAAQFGVAVRRNVENLRRRLADPQMFRFLMIALLGFLAGIRSGGWRTKAVVALFALGPLAVVAIHVETRFLYGNVVTAWAAGMAGLAAQGSGWRRLAAGVLVALGVANGILAWRAAMMTARARGPYPVAAIAEEMRRMGVREDSRFCWIGEIPRTGELAWELKGRVVAQIREGEYHAWMAEHGELPASVDEAFRSAGCEAGVAVLGDAAPTPTRWEKIGNWPVYVRILGQGRE